VPSRRLPRCGSIYADEVATVVDLLARVAVDVAALTSDVRPVAAGIAAFRDPRDGDRAVKVLLEASGRG